MNKRTVAAVLTAGVLAGGGVALTAPNIALAANSQAASTATTSPSATDRAAARLSAIANALKGLVTDGTLTQAQADKVASTLAQAHLGDHRGPRGPHGVRGGGLSPVTVAKVLGVTEEELRTAVENGQTLSQIAASKGIGKSDLISRLVAAARTQLKADLDSQKITQAQYDRALSTLTERVTKRVDRVGFGRDGRHEGPDRDGDAPNAPDAPGDNTTTSSASPSPTA